MARRFRVIDTGIRNGRYQIAFDQAMIDARKAGLIPDSVRFLRFPPTALVGRHQALSREINLDYCRGHGIGIARRITGGGGIYFDEGQLGWELVFDRSSLGISTLPELAGEICEAAAAGLRRLGIDARYRPRNDIEVDGRKISGTAGFFDEDTLFYQGTLLVDMNPGDIAAALNVPAAKLARKALDSAAKRVVTLKELLGTPPAAEAIKSALLAGFVERLGIEPFAADVTETEEALARKHFDEDIGTDAFVAEIDDPDHGDGVLTASHTGAGGTVSVHVRLDGAARDRIRDVLFTGDFLVTPPRVVLDLEARLRGLPVSQVGQVTERFLAATGVGLLALAPADFRAAIESAIGPTALGPTAIASTAIASTAPTSTI